MIRMYEPGDEAAQVGIYNEAAAALPKFKAATLDEVRRRCRATDFDPATRLFAVEDGRPVGYATFQPNGRVSYPWCRKGCEKFAEPLFDQLLNRMRAAGLNRAFAAYRADWPALADFFRSQGFTAAREVVNFVLNLADMPTPAARSGAGVSPLTPADVPAVLELGAGALRVQTAAQLEAHLFHNSYFGPDALFALRAQTGSAPLAVGLLVVNPAYADPRQVDAAMPCFRLGAFGTEGLSVKRINGLFSFLAAPDRSVSALGLDLFAHAARLLEDTAVEAFAAQAASDAPHLLRFYKQYCRQQGSFPIFERAL
jgi:hypothetical protein